MRGVSRGFSYRYPRLRCDCHCDLNPGKCKADLHQCICQDESFEYSRSQGSVDTGKGWAHCKAEAHLCRCLRVQGERNCRSDSHDCTCLCSPESLAPKKCNADVHACSCVFIVMGNASCERQCLAAVHDCLCDTRYRHACVADDHICVCGTGVKCKRSDDHRPREEYPCICPDPACDCLDDNHDCTCKISVRCRGKNHLCVCILNPSRCLAKATEHQCACKLFLGHCKLDPHDDSGSELDDK